MAVLQFYQYPLPSAAVSKFLHSWTVLHWTWLYIHLLFFLRWKNAQYLCVAKALSRNIENIYMRKGPAKHLSSTANSGSCAFWVKSCEGPKTSLCLQDNKVDLQHFPVGWPKIWDAQVSKDKRQFISHSNNSSPSISIFTHFLNPSSHSATWRTPGGVCHRKGIPNFGNLNLPYTGQ